LEGCPDSIPGRLSALIISLRAYACVIKGMLACLRQAQQQT